MNRLSPIEKGIITSNDGNDASVGRSGQILTSDFMLEVAKGNVEGHSHINKFGHNPEITTGTDPEDVWGGGGIYGFYPDVAQSMEMLSSSDEDGAAGETGALTAIVYGLDVDFNEVNETVTLSGTAPVALTVNTYRRIFRVVVLTAGSNETNVGNISLRIVTVGTVGAYIVAGDGQTQQAIYTIPNNKTGYFIKGYVGISKGGGSSAVSADFKWKARPNNGTTGAWATQGQIESISTGSSWWQYQYGIPAGPLPEKTDIRLECVEVSATLGVVGGYDMLLVEDGF